MSGITTEVSVPSLARFTVMGLDGSGAYAAVSGRTTPTANKQVYRLHIPSSTVVLCSRNASGLALGGTDADIDAGGNRIVFTTLAALVPGDTNNAIDVYAYDVSGDVMQRVSLSSLGAQADLESTGQPSIDAAGRYVAFSSRATNLVPVDTNNRQDAFVRDLELGLTSLVSLTSAQGQLQGGTIFAPIISGDGTAVVFLSQEPIAPLDGWNGSVDVFVRSLAAGTLLPVSTGVNSGQMMNIRGMGAAFDGSEVLFASEQPGMTQLPRLTGIFVAKYGTRCSIFDYCTALPNSTGRLAQIGTYGTASMAHNALTIAASDLPTTTMAMLVSGTNAIEPGTPFGNGLLCIGGTLQRHGVQAVAAGVFFETPDVTSPAYSNLRPGDVRNYQVYYRDALAGGAMFNTTPAVSVTFCW